MAKEKMSLDQKIHKDYPEFAAVIDSMGVDELEERLSAYAKEREKTDEHLKENEDIKAKKAELSELTGPYNDTLKALKLKIKYIIASIKDKGGKVA